MKFKGFLFTLDAVFALIIAGVAISILIYFNFIPLTTYQFSSSEVYNLMQNLIGTQISNISQSSLIGNYSTATYYAKSDQWPYFGANSNLTSNSSYGPQMLDLLFTYKTPGNIISSPVANNGKIAFETSNQIFVLNSSTGSNYLNITTNSIINGNASVLLYKDSLIYMTSNTIDSINLINKQGSVINQNLVLNSFIVASVPITLTNSQTFQTPAPFQQMITIDPASYKAYEAGNLQNIEFFYANGTIIPSWLESGNSNTSTQAIYWLKLNNGIPAQTSITIYMGFGSISTNFFNGNTIGEAPQLSSTYAEYDDGASVFTNYWNFAGTALPTGWTGSSTVNNGISIPYSSYADTTATYLNPDNILEFYGDIPIATSDYNACSGYIGSSSAESVNSVCFDINTGVISSGDAFGLTATTAPTAAYSSTVAIGTGTNIWGIFWQSASAAYFNVNYGAYSELTTNIPTSGVPIGFANTQGSQATLSFTWLRTRAYPPNGVMPTQATGPIIQLPTNNAAPIADAPISIEDGYIAEGTLSGFYLLNLSNFGIYTSILTSIFGIPNIMTPAYADGEFIISSSSRFKNYIMSYSLNGKVLSQNWNYSLTSSPTTSPSIYNNTIYVGSGDNLYAFTLGGNLIFNVLLGSQIKGISISNNEIFVQCQNSIYG
ncbi:MAG: PQQ-binding-like beta-propeller repeat protein, partial [Candidatus Marsarchaeota archaeon]|nr:PQQ-binding-like beta-propeller repeat protein [Candidatus Marsarchaeota archaeon]